MISNNQKQISKKEVRTEQLAKFSTLRPYPKSIKAHMPLPIIHVSNCVQFTHICSIISQLVRTSSKTMISESFKSSDCTGKPPVISLI